MTDNGKFFENAMAAKIRLMQPDLSEAYQQLEAKMINIYKLSGLTLDDVIFHLMKGDIFASPDLFKNQQAEINRLRNILLCFMNEVSKWENKHGLDVSELPLIPIKDESEKIKEQIKAEAIKEFAERLKNLVHHTTFSSLYGVMLSISENDFDNLVKEMVGDEE